MDFHCEKLKLTIKPFRAGVEFCAKRQRPRRLRIRDEFLQQILTPPREPCDKCEEGRRHAEWAKGEWRRCWACKTELPLDSVFFHRDRTRRHKMHHSCKVCERKRQHEYYIRNKERRLAYMKDYWDRWRERKAA